jgi:hypothetical protein
MYSKKQDFFDTPEGKEIEEILKHIASSDDFSTSSSYSPNSDLYMNNSMTFVEKHMAYIRSHPKVNPGQYVSNLKISSRKK